VLDALANGSITLSESHPIVTQYGFPDGLVTDIEHLEESLNAFRGEDAAPALYRDYDEHCFARRWREFLEVPS
jgi:hypothetical protein